MASAEEVVALYSFSAKCWDELSFKKGDKIKVIEKPEEWWWIGELNGRIGLFPNNYISYKDKMKVNYKEEKRQQHINELINTEKTFINDISIINEVFKKRLVNSRLLTNEQLGTIFNNWPKIVECHTKLLCSFQDRRDNNAEGVVMTLGDVLQKNLPSIKDYEDYCTSEHKIRHLLQKLRETNKEYSTLIKMCEFDPRAQRLSLSSFLIKPIQRITKYPLLIKKILEYTPNDHIDRPYLEKSLLKAENLCRQVNELVREKEGIKILEWLQNHILFDELTEPLTFNSLTHNGFPRKIIHYGSLSKTLSKKGMVGFLTSDFLLLGQPTSPLQEQFSFEKHHNILLTIYKLLLLSNLTVLGNPWNTTAEEFQLEYNRTVLFLTAPSLNEKNLWLNKLIQGKNKIKERETEKFIKQNSISEKKRPIGMLKLKIVSAKNLCFPVSHFGNEVICELRVGNQEISTLSTPMRNDNNPSWNTLFRFLIKDLKEDVVHLTLKKKATFSPDRFLGSSKLPILDVIELIQKPNIKCPVKRVLKLENVFSGEVCLLLDIRLFKYYNSGIIRS